MSSEIDPLHVMPLDELAQECAQETERFYHPKSDDPKSHDPKYCLEIFRRAIVIRNNDAWKALCFQYQSQVERWVYRHRYFPLVSKHDEPQDFIAEAFERFWNFFTPDKFGKSQSLGAVLTYLQMCVNSTILDSWRKMRRSQFNQELGSENEDEEQGPFEPEPTPEEILQKDELWQLIKARLKDQKEYTVVYASFNLDLSPREILVEYPSVFHDIKEIYQYKANVLARLKRDPEIRDLFNQND